MSEHDPVPAALDDQAPRRVRHLKRGTTYRVIGEANVQTAEPLGDDAWVVVYQCERDGRIWVRPKREFEDGRFEDLPAVAGDQVSAGRYRKKPVVIEAMQFPSLGDVDAMVAFEDWFLSRGGRARYVGQYLHITTLEDGPNGEAKHVADPGDWIIRGVAGEFYPCKPHIFSATYEPADQAPAGSAAGLDPVGWVSQGTAYRLKQSPANREFITRSDEWQNSPHAVPVYSAEDVARLLDALKVAEEALKQCVPLIEKTPEGVLASVGAVSALATIRAAKETSDE